MKKNNQITFKLSADLYQELQKRSTADLSPSLVARDLVEDALRNHVASCPPEAAGLARAVWLIIASLSQDISSEQAADLVRRCFLDGRNAPELNP